jgi:hypothetical protein
LPLEKVAVEQRSSLLNFKDLYVILGMDLDLKSDMVPKVPDGL